MHRRHRYLLAGLLAVALCAAGCSTTQSVRRQAPAYARAADHYRSFNGADELARYLRADSEAGPLVSAHRGGAAPLYPENALATFERALRYGPSLMECDIRMTRDGVLVLMHDETLDRTTTGRGLLAAEPMEAVRQLLLVDGLGVITPFRVPTLDEALAWARERAVLVLDIKEGVSYLAIAEAILRHDAQDRTIVVTRTLSEVLELRRLAPEVMISADIHTTRDLEDLLESGVDATRLVAFTGVGEPNPEVIDLAHAHGIRVILGTFGLVDERAMAAGANVYRSLIDRGVDIIASDAVALASEAVEAYQFMRAR